MAQNSRLAQAVELFSYTRPAVPCDKILFAKRFMRCCESKLSQSPGLGVLWKRTYIGFGLHSGVVVTKKLTHAPVSECYGNERISHSACTRSLSLQKSSGNSFPHLGVAGKVRGVYLPSVTKQNIGRNEEQNPLPTKTWDGR